MNKFLFVISGPIPAYQLVWVIRDEFVTDTFGQYFQNDDNGTMYMKQNYEVKPFYGNRFSLMTNVVACIHNNLVKVINENKLLPKAIIFVIDGDIIKTVKYDNYGITEIFGQILKNLMTGIHCTILAQKDALPHRSKRSDYPTVLWCLAPQHINFPDNWNINRKKFNSCLESLVALFPEMGLLRMKKFWDYNNSQLFLDCRFTAIAQIHQE